MDYEKVNFSAVDRNGLGHLSYKRNDDYRS